MQLLLFRSGDWMFMTAAALLMHNLRGVSPFQQQHRLLFSRPSSPLYDASSTTTASDSTTTESPPTTILLNPLLSRIQPSKTVEIFSQVKQMQANGITTITSLCVGEPDFGPPPSVLQGVQDAMDQGDTKYTAVTGTVHVRQAILHDLQRRGRLATDTTTIDHVIVSNGAKQAVWQALLAVAGDGDRVVIPAPYWPSYPEQVRLCGAEPVIVNTTAESGYRLEPQALQEALQEHGDSIKAVILCHPSNPTGSVYTKEQLQALAQVLPKSVVVIADEIYERLTYQGMECPSMAVTMGSTHSVITINGCSKALAMTGFRLGYAIAPSLAIATALSTLQSQFTSCASSIAQAAAVAAWQTPDTTDAWLHERVKELQAKRDYVWDTLQDMPGVVCLAQPPEGAFYVLPDVSAYCGENDTEFCVQLLQRQELAIVPGSSFGAPGTVRLSYATSMDELEIAMEKLNRFLEEERTTNMDINI